MAKTLPLPANQVGSPCERRSPASGKARHILRKRSTSGASRELTCLTGCDGGFAAASAELGARFFALALLAVAFPVAPDRLLAKASSPEDRPLSRPFKNSVPEGARH